VVNLDPALGQEFLYISVGQSVAEVPAHSQQDDLRREPVPGKRSGLSAVVAIYQNMLAEPHPIRQRNSAVDIASGATVTFNLVCANIGSSGSSAVNDLVLAAIFSLALRIGGWVGQRPVAWIGQALPFEPLTVVGATRSPHR